MLEIFILTCVIFKDSVESEKPYELKEENKKEDSLKNNHPLFPRYLYYLLKATYIP